MSLAPTGVAGRVEYGEMSSPGQLLNWPILRPTMKVILMCNGYGTLEESQVFILILHTECTEPVFIGHARRDKIDLIQTRLHQVTLL